MHGGSPAFQPLHQHPAMSSNCYANQSCDETGEEGPSTDNVGSLMRLVYSNPGWSGEEAGNASHGALTSTAFGYGVNAPSSFNYCSNEPAGGMCERDIFSMPNMHRGCAPEGQIQDAMFTATVS